MDDEHEYSPVDDSDEDPHFVPNANEESESLDSSLQQTWNPIALEGMPPSHRKELVGSKKMFSKM